MSDPRSIVEQLTRRIEILETQNRRIRTALTFLLAVSLICVFMGAFAKQESGVERQTAFQLVDDDGTVRASLTLVKNHPVFQTFDANGQERIWLGHMSDADVGLTIRDENREQRVALTAATRAGVGTSRLTLRNVRDGEVAGSTDLASQLLTFRERNAEGMEQLGTVSADGFSFHNDPNYAILTVQDQVGAFLRLGYGDGNVNLGCDASGTHSNYLSLVARRATENWSRIRLDVSDGGPRIQVKNTEGTSIFAKP